MFKKNGVKSFLEEHALNQELIINLSFVIK